MNNTKTTVDFKNVFDLEFDGIDHADHPDYCDAYITNAKSKDGDEFRDATDEEIEIINDDSQFVYENLMEHLF
jgi:hypothetical protein